MYINRLSLDAQLNFYDMIQLNSEIILKAFKLAF